MKWFNFRKNRKEPEALPVELNKEVETKSSKGEIDEGTSYGIGYGDDYVNRILQYTGLTTYEMWRCYVENPWVRSCIDKIIKEVVKYKVSVKPKDPENISKETEQHVEEVKELLANPNIKIESFDNLRRKYLKDILVYDAGALEIVKENAGNIENLKNNIQTKSEEIKKLIIKDKSILDAKLSNTNKVKIEELRRELNELKKAIKKEKEKTSTSKPVELYDIAGINIKLNVDKHGSFKDDNAAYYFIDANSKKIAEFAKDELIYFIANPTAGSIYGLSPIETLYNIIQADNQAAKLNRRRLDSDGIISGVLSFPGMGKAKLKANQNFWKQRAKKKGASLVVTSSPDVQFIRVAESHQEMQFMEYQKWTLTQIMAVYGLQPIVLGVIDPTTGKLNSKEQRAQFKSDAILPLLSLEAHHLTDVLVNQAFGYDDIEIYHEEPAQELTKIENTDVADRMGKLGVITINEAREMIGLDSLDEGGDVLILNASLKNIVEDVNKSQRKDKLEEIKNRINELLSDDTPKTELNTEIE
jgi:HK97 family phage portal protein